jgi:4'-phosphopantetheinyl transferase
MAEGGRKKTKASRTEGLKLSPTAVLYPVILAVPPAGRSLKGREKAAFLSACARRALDISAGRSDACLGAPEKDNAGAPIPCQGWHWSVSHKSQFVAGVVAAFPVGIDIEKIRPISDALVRKVAAEAGSVLGRKPSAADFFRIWTAKEAVLKAEGVGLAGLSACRLNRFHNANHLMMGFSGRHYAVAQFFWDDHVAAVVTGGGRVDWVVISQAEG